MSTSRRNAIKSIATAALAVPVAAQQHVHHSGELLQIATARPYTPKFFSAAQLETVRLLVDLIIPRTDTPGAADAGVHRFIDSDVSRRPDLQTLWRDALTWLDAEAQRSAGTSFEGASRAQQISILNSASSSTSAPGWPHFTLAKGAAVDAYYGTKEGLNTELGWNANTFLPEFEGCTHKEHQG